MTNKKRTRLLSVVLAMAMVFSMWGWMAQAKK